VQRRAQIAATVVALSVAVVGCSAGTHQPSSPPEPQIAHIGVGAIASPGCHLSRPAPRVRNRIGTVSVLGANRHYLLTTPAPHVLPAPLVLDFHGYGEGALTESLTSGFGDLGQRDGFLVAFPVGSGTPIGWDTSSAPGNPDVRFVSALLDRLEATQCIDEARVYATGLSQGAFMTSTLACVLSGRLAAVAPVAGVVLPRPCPTTRPVPLLAFHGTKDPILHFNGGIGRKVLAADLSARPQPLPELPKARLFGPGYPAHVAAWASKDGCRARATDTSMAPGVIHRSYLCPTGVAVEFDIIVGGGHTWPGSMVSAQIAAFVGPTTMQIDATTAIWAFFRQFHLAHVPPS
jgi:polyhydroxybutyrate depolymerase